MADDGKKSPETAKKDKKPNQKEGHDDTPQLAGTKHDTLRGTKKEKKQKKDKKGTVIAGTRSPSSQNVFIPPHEKTGPSPPVSPTSPASPAPQGPSMVMPLPEAADDTKNTIKLAISREKDQVLDADQLKEEQRTRIDSVTVYGADNVAEVTRRIEVGKLKKGNNEIIVTGLPPAPPSAGATLRKDSIRVSGALVTSTVTQNPSVTILEVSYHTVPLPKKKPVLASHDSIFNQDNAKKNNQLTIEQEIEHYRKEQTELGHEITQINNHIEAYEKVAQLLQGYSNKVTSSFHGQSPSPTSVQNLSNFLALYKKKQRDVSMKLLQLRSRLDDSTKKKNVVEKNLQILGSIGEKNEDCGEVTLSLFSAEDDNEVTVSLSYLVNNANWTASYDCRVNSNTKSLSLQYFATIQQYTTEHWRDIQLSLSTSSPSIGGLCPKLYPSSVGWRRIHIQPLARRNFSAVPSSSVSASVSPSADDSESEQDEDAYGGGGLSPRRSELSKPTSNNNNNNNVMTSQAESSQLSTTFTIQRAATIDSDNKAHKVTVALIELESKFKYHAVPKMDTSAYLQASTLNKSNFPFLAGPVAVFFDNNFVAQSFLKSVSPSESFDTFLGVDPAIKIEYKKGDAFKETGGGMFSGKSHIENFNFRTTIKNTKAIDVEVTIVDQLPLSSEKEIKVKLISPTQESLDKEKDANGHVRLNLSNNIEWKYNLKPGDEKEIVYKYQLEYPNSRTIENY